MFREGSMLVRLILINVAVFVLAHLVNVVSVLMGRGDEMLLVEWLASTSNLSELLFKPWSLITYMFLHEEFMHIFWNMVILYFVGRIFLQFLGSKRMLSTYTLAV